MSIVPTISGASVIGHTSWSGKWASEISFAGLSGQVVDGFEFVGNFALSDAIAFFFVPKSSTAKRPTPVGLLPCAKFRRLGLHHTERDRCRHGMGRNTRRREARGLCPHRLHAKLSAIATIRAMSPSATACWAVDKDARRLVSRGRLYFA